MASVLIFPNHQTRMIALLGAVFMLAVASAHTAAGETAVTARLNALERGLASATDRISALENSLAAAAALNDKLMDTIEELRQDIAASQWSSHGPDAKLTYCACNGFNSSTVTLNPAATGDNVNLNVGTPTTGFINGVNINQLANEAVLNFGSQSISGSLTVNSLNIGGIWTLTVDGSGNLDVQSTVGSGGIVVGGGITAGGDVQATGAVTAASGTSTFEAVVVQTGVNATSIGTSSLDTSALSSSSSYNLCSSGLCVNEYPQFQTLSASPGGSVTCPDGWILVSASICCYNSGNSFWYQPQAIPPGVNSASVGCDRGSECGDGNQPDYYTCMSAST